MSLANVSLTNDGLIPLTICCFCSVDRRTPNFLSSCATTSQFSFLAKVAEESFRLRSSGSSVNAFLAYFITVFRIAIMSLPKYRPFSRAMKWSRCSLQIYYSISTLFLLSSCISSRSIIQKYRFRSSVWACVRVREFISILLFILFAICIFMF